MSSRARASKNKRTNLSSRVNSSKTKKATESSPSIKENGFKNENAPVSKIEEPKPEETKQTMDSYNNHSNKTSNIRDKFEKGDADAKPKKEKRPTRIRYAGVKSAKTKFIEEATKPPTQEDGVRKPRQITPPREGVASGILESEPQARAPGIITCDDDTGDSDLAALATRTKNMRAMFKDMESGKITNSVDNKVLKEVQGLSTEAMKLARTKWHDIEAGKQEAEVDSEAMKELNNLSPEAMQLVKSKWKDIESGKLSNGEVQRKKIDINDGAYSGVFENTPAENPNVIRHDMTTHEALPSASAKEKKEMLLKQAMNQNAVQKINPMEELKQLAEQEKNTVYENKPMNRPDGLVVATDETEDFKNLTSAKSNRAKFVDGSAFKEHDIKKTVVEIAADQGGVFENEPARRSDVIHCDDDADEAISGKWASDAKKRFMEDAENRAKQAKENKAEDVSGGKYATEARERFLQKQKEAEENRNKPKVIDIWSELSDHSGVFENQPAERSKDIIVCGQSSDDEEDYEGEMMHSGNGPNTPAVPAN